MQRLRLAFRLEDEKHFIVMAERDSGALKGLSGVAAQTTYDHEDSFLRLLIVADLDDDTTRRLVVGVVLSVANPDQHMEWVRVSLSLEQCRSLGLKLPEARALGARSEPERSAPPAVFSENAEHFYDFLMNAPAPFAMLTGPEHTVRFINDPYVKILARTSREQILGLPILEAIPELKGQQCLSHLERVYETGVPQVRREMLNRFLREETGQLEEVYFDIVYHPVRDGAGHVNGVMAQATDVTERVLSRQVSDHREQKLYRLWAELESIYDVAPIGVAVLEAADLRLLRLNQLQAGFLGATMQELTAKLMSEIACVPSELLSLLKRAAEGEKVTNVKVEIATGGLADERYVLSISVRPSLNTFGVVETITLVSLDIKAAGAREREFLERDAQLVATDN